MQNTIPAEQTAKDADISINGDVSTVDWKSLSDLIKNISFSEIGRLNLTLNGTYGTYSGKNKTNEHHIVL